MTDPALTDPNLPAWQTIARTFPSFADVKRWPASRLTPDELDAAAGSMSSGERHAAAFLCSIWNGNEEIPARRKHEAFGPDRKIPRPFPRVGAFNVARAGQTWDRGHRAAFANWAAGRVPTSEIPSYVDAPAMRTF